MKKKIPHEDQQAQQVLSHCRSVLGEHFDIVVMAVSRKRGGITEFYHFEVGNDFGVVGLMESYADQLQGQFDVGQENEELHEGED